MSVDTAPSYTEEFASDLAEYEISYRAISKWAVVSLTLGLLSIVAFLDPFMAIVPVIGILMGWNGLRQIARHPDLYTGRPLAFAGMMLSLAMLAAGVSWQLYDYHTEVPEGYTRISYDPLQPPPHYPEDVAPESAMALEGERVFIKGYVYPTRQMKNIKEFVLCRDNGDCCFGGTPKLTDKILVKLKDPLELTYSQRQFKLAGTFRVLPADSGDVGEVLYQLDADYLK